jgi:hypothetical protein
MIANPSPAPASACECNPAPLFSIIMQSLVLRQSVFAAAEFGIADLLAIGPKSVSELAAQLHLDESSLGRILRLLASEGIFAESTPGVFANNAVSNCLRSDAHLSVRALARFGGSDFVYGAFAEILHSVRTGQPGRLKTLGMEGWEYLKNDAALARLFDDAMTCLSSLAAPGIAAAYDFGKWESLMDVGGGNGVLLAAILQSHPTLRGVLADQAHVLERARERGFPSALETRFTMQPCDLFQNIPAGCCAYLMKSVIHDWNDTDAVRILRNARKAVPENGALLLVESNLPENGSPSRARFVDVTMLVLTGGKERTSAEYGALLEQADFRLNRVTPTPSDFNILEALPV